MTILGVFLLLMFLVLIHEWGHYIAAKKTGVHVEEFGFGYPPRALTMFVRKGTLFTLNWLPLGGFVRLAGDDAESFEQLSLSEAARKKSVKGGSTKHLFSFASPLKRLIIVYAGAAINLLFGVLVFGAIYTYIGKVPVALPHPVIEEVVTRSPAQAAGLQKGDVVLSLDGKIMKTSQQFIGTLKAFRGKHVSILLERQEKRISLNPYVRTEQETPQGEGSLGVIIIDTTFTSYPVWQMPFFGVVQGFKDSLSFAGMILSALRDLVVDLVSRGRVPEAVSGPIGIVSTAAKEKLFAQGPLVVLNFAALISINLAVINVLPIPPLDGGRALFILFERVLGKRRRARLEYYANQFGMMFFLALILLVSVKDIFLALK